MNTLTQKSRRDFSDATRVFIGEGRQRIDDSLSLGDRKHIYSFTLQKSSAFRVSLKRLEHDATLTVFDESSARIAKSQKPGTQRETIRKKLEPGTYFIQVNGRGRRPETTYRLNLVNQARETTGPSVPAGLEAGNASVDLAGNSTFTARNLGILDGTQVYTDWVGNTDTIDYYQFSLTTATLFSLELTNLAADADVALIDQSGAVLQESILPDANSEFISQILNTGLYFVRVSRYSGQTSYTLTLDANPDIPAQFSTKTGYGLVNAAAVVAESIGQSNPFPDVLDLEPTWGVDAIKAPEVWNQGFTGKGVTVAVLDSGVDFTHPDLKSNIWINANEIAGNGIDDDGNGFIDDVRGWDFIDNDGRPMDRNGHGTHVAGTIAAKQNSFGVTGVAPDAKVMPVRVLDADGFGSVSGIVEGIYYAINNGANIINLSLGGNISTPLLRTAIQDAFNQGVVVVMAAGNESSLEPSFPATYANRWGIAVGASDRTNNFAFFSNQAGSKPLDYVVAPGVSVESTLPGNRYGFLSGTSMATPHVAGVIALALQANPNLTPAAIETLLISTTTAIA